MTPLGEITQPAYWLLIHMLPAYWRKLLVVLPDPILKPTLGGAIRAAGISGIGPGLCWILHLNFREYPFYELE
jgi:hypothetical protein